VAIEVRDKLVNGENFTAMVEQYAQNAYSQTAKGDFGLHPRSILQGETNSAVPLDFAFSAEAGQLSPPLADNASYKQVGYWLIKDLDRPSDNETTVDALYLSSRDEALGIKARLEAGDNLSALADQYSQYTQSKEKHGELGAIARPSDNTTTAVSAAFDGYVFDPNTELGIWSDPIQDTIFATQGGYWLVQVIDKQINTKLSDDDRSSLIDQAYDDWINDLYTQYSAKVDISGLTDDIRAWAIARAHDDLAQAGGVAT
jgi:parvulin-like peptidyl-prolyl isomerase